MSTLQSILFDKDKFDLITARHWLKNNDMHPIKKAHNTKNYIRYRLATPQKNSDYRIIELSDGVKAVYMY